VPAANAPTLTFWTPDGEVILSGDGTDNRFLKIGTSDHGVRLDPVIAHNLEVALRNVEIVALPTAPSASDPNELKIEWTGSRAALGAEAGCNGDPALVTLDAPSGGGCVRWNAAQAVRDVLGKLHSSSTILAAKAPVPFPIGVVQFSNGQELDVTK